MANKMTAKLSATIANLFGGKTQPKSVKVILEEAREREKLLMSKMEILLDEIQYNSNLKLPKEKIKEFRIENRVARMRKALETPLITKIDTEELDNQILSFADSLKLALEQGYEHAAYWSSMALLKTVETLRIDTPELYARDPEMEKALYINKLTYADNFYNIIQASIKQDRAEKQLATLEADFNNKAADMRNRENSYKALMETEAGRKLNAAVEAKKSNPASMTDAEKSVVANHKRIDSLRKQLKELHADWEVLDTDLTALTNQVESMRLQLLADPEVHDEKLAAKIKESAKIFRASLEKRLDESYLMMTAYEEGVTQMEELLKHPAIKAKYASIAQSLADMENEWLTRAQSELEAHRTAVRKAQNAAMMERQVDKLHEELLEFQYQVEQERQQQLHKAIADEVEVEEETEQETETEYESDI